MLSDCVNTAKNEHLTQQVALGWSQAIDLAFLTVDRVCDFAE